MSRKPSKHYNTPVKKWQQRSPLQDDLCIYQSSDSEQQPSSLFLRLVGPTPSFQADSPISEVSSVIGEEDFFSEESCSHSQQHSHDHSHTVRLMNIPPVLQPNRVVLAPIDPNRRGCRCLHSKCQKKYCQCFQAGLTCIPGLCQCVQCCNLQVKDIHRHNKMKMQVQQTAGCKCKKSKCLKKYCQCFANGRLCGPTCECVECCNMDQNRMGGHRHGKREIKTKNQGRTPLGIINDLQ